MSRRKIVAVTAAVMVALCTWIGIREYHVRTVAVRPSHPPQLIEADVPTPARHDATASKLATASPEVGVHFEPSHAAVKGHQMPLDPAYIAMVKHDAHVAQMRSNFGDFITGAQLTAAEAAQLLDLLAEEREAALELIVGARDRGIYWGADPDLETAVLAAGTSQDAEIARLLGPERLTQFDDFRDTAMIRMSLVELNDRLIDEGQPLTDGQTRKLIQTFSAMENPANARRAPIKAVVQVIGMHVTDEMVEAARSILSASQLSALRSLQIAQQNPERTIVGSPNTTSAVFH